MFSKLIKRNSKRERTDNGLYYSSMIICIVAFYIILSLPNQDVIIFLKKMESEALGRLFEMVPILFVLSLFILFFLVYFVSCIQMQRRRYEFGIYLTLGMKRSKLFLMLFEEDVRNSLLALGVGIPLGVLISECISLVTAKIVGLGIIGHHVSFSVVGIIFTIVGMMTVKAFVFLLLTMRMMKQEIGQFLISQNTENKRLKSTSIYIFSTLLGITGLVIAYRQGLTGKAWKGLANMSLTLFLGIMGTILFFFGLRRFISVLMRLRKKRALFVYNFRQIEEFIIQRSTMMAICSLLIFFALSLFGAGVAISSDNRFENNHVLDYTLKDDTMPGEEKLTISRIKEILNKEGLDSVFSKWIEIHVGTPKKKNTISLKNIIRAMKSADAQGKREVFIENLEGLEDAYILSLSGYNEIREACNQKPIHLNKGEAALYMGQDFLLDENFLNSILKENPTVDIMGDHLKIVGNIEKLPLVADRQISISAALILPDEVFRQYSGGKYKSYISGILTTKEVKEKGLMRAILDTDEKLEKTELKFQSYLQNRGRQLFYIVSASYITIYMAVILLIVSHTIIGVMFLMSQRKSYQRHQTLVNLGATYSLLCQSNTQQIHWHFALPIGVALLNSIFGVGSLFLGILPSSIRMQFSQKMAIALSVIVLLAFFEWIYIVIVKKNSEQYLWKIMEPKRIE